MPIITSLLDVDFYKLTMAQFVWKLHRDVQVAFAFANRTRDMRLPETVAMNDLGLELVQARALRFAPEEIAWLRDSEHTRGLFEEGFLDFLAELKLPPFLVREAEGEYRIEVSGRWPEVTLWETIVLSVVNELHFQAVVDANDAWLCGARRLEEKLLLLDAHPGLRVAEFGTRRRYSRAWQDHVVSVMARRHRLGLMPQLVGTSNVALAMKYGLRPIGTMAHELFMGYAGIYGVTDEGLLASHGRVLDDWEATYGPRLMTALTDTWGTDFFVRDMGKERFERWPAFRLDSGDPFEDGEKIVRALESHAIDPTTKTLVPSDGLDTKRMIALHERFAGRVGVSFGCGTHYSNDVGARPLSIVMKLVRAAGRPTVKLSNDPAKAMGPAPEVERTKRVFGRVDAPHDACRT